MSWWDRYFVPGDLRAQQQLPPSSAPLLASTQQDEQIKSSPPVAPQRIDAAHRARRQNALLFGGLAFTSLSALLMRRAIRKKQLATYPQFTTKVAGSRDPVVKVPTFTPSNTQAKAEGGLDAAEALFLATLSTFSIFMTGTGAFMKLYDIADVEDLREFVKQGIGYDVYSGETEADKEIETWFAEVLSRKDGTGNLREEIVTKMAELGELEEKRKREVEEKGLLQKIETKKRELEERR
ncbi:hypothetical protein DOTSEDRAFT_75405 [Dothistroma septosporum NZE10]|uniref:Altered inheritance of mitochondria protein 11 n=1 Tax=Dothistroma septosporum (strain NZE10 / CBS 128990) TaxID=675120 RepID=M2XGL0_DOTSN|nr:hypothetical protein DOTSEDRAFT_75405 [Dothistroma septosporum NZE10]